MAIEFKNGVIADTPSTLLSEIRVSVPDLSYMGRVTYGPMSFHAEPGSDGFIRLPQKGDKALIAQDNQGGRPWIVSHDATGALYNPIIPPITTRSIGIVAGNNGSIPGTWAALPNLAFVYTTPNIPTRAEIKIQARFEAFAASWTFVYLGLSVLPAPTSKLHVNSLVGGTLGTLGLQWLHNAGVAAVGMPVWETTLLAPNTLYTFQAVALSNGAIWGTGTENYMMGTFYPENA